MGTGDIANYHRFTEMCSELNLDPDTKEEALKRYEKIKENYSLEGDAVHWLACALYDACRRQSIPTVGNGHFEGNAVSLTRLLRIAHLSLIQFFNKIKKWADMANLNEAFRSRVDRLERNFAVSTVIFKKFRPIFVSVFKDPANDPPRPAKNRKHRPKPCTPSDIYEFVWRMFVLAKGNFPAISDDLVNSYHLLLCVIDWVFMNCIVGRREDLIHPGFHGISVTGPDSLCIISRLCREHDGLEVEAKGIKEHHFKSYVKKLLENGTLKGTQQEHRISGVLDINFFDDNCKSLDRAYEEYVLTLGDFDERIFLGKDADAEIGTPAGIKTGSYPVEMDGPTLLLEAAARSQANPLLQQHIDQSRAVLCPKTPLTGRHHLPEQSNVTLTPVSGATQGVTRLHTILSGRKYNELAASLTSMFSECKKNPQQSIQERVAEMSELFCKAYTMPCNQQPASHADFAQMRMQSSVMLYYKILENIMVTEKRRMEKTQNKSLDLTPLLEQDVFHRSLFACCLEIVIFSYNSQRTFPWVLAVYDLQPYHFYKVIELAIRAEDGFSRDVIKHLNAIEESILDCLAWKSDSPLWEYIQLQLESGSSLPHSEEVSLQNQPTVTKQHPLGSALLSPRPHPQIRRLAMSDGKLITKDSRAADSPIGSPGRNAPLASERFSSPTSGTARRRLFPAQSSKSAESSPVKQQIITFQQTSMEDGRQILIPVQIMASVTPTTPSKTVTVSKTTASGSVVTISAPSGGTAGAAGSAPVSQEKPKPKRTGSLSLFFRKVYHLVSVRLRDICDKLCADDQLRRCVWTTFEECLVNHVELMKDRHLDQFVMCAVYSICKISGKEQSFQDIMRYYRLQPQAQSHVYRSVLLSKVTPTDTHSQTSDDSTSSDRIQDRVNLLRSSSTLPQSLSGSAPPTPTRPSGSSSMVSDGEERGDLIKFYNTVYVRKMKQFVLRFNTRSRSSGDSPALSSLPEARQIQTSPRRVSDHHSIYISPHKRSAANLLTPNSRMLYCFNSSPAKDLRAINNMLRMGERRALTSIADRKPIHHEVVEGPAIKRIKFNND